MFGYHLRFNPLIINLKKMLQKKKIGNILNVLSENGEHIADYRKYQKYWEVYHSKKRRAEEFCSIKYMKLTIFYFCLININ